MGIKEFRELYKDNGDPSVKTGTDVTEIMDLVNFFTIFLLTSSFVLLCLYGTNPRDPMDPVVMNIILCAGVFYFGHDLLWILLGLLWFVGLGIKILLSSLSTPDTEDIED